MLFQNPPTVVVLPCSPGAQVCPRMESGRSPGAFVLQSVDAWNWDEMGDEVNVGPLNIWVTAPVPYVIYSPLTYGIIWTWEYGFYNTEI